MVQTIDTLSRTARLVIMALGSDGNTIMHVTGYAPTHPNYKPDFCLFHFAVMQRGGTARFIVPPATARKLIRDGLIVQVTERTVGDLVFSEYALTDSVRALLKG